MRMFGCWHVLATVITIASTTLQYAAATPIDGDASASVRSSPLKFMFVGDSITHGYEGAYTWRYRMWEWMRENEIDFDFVGPYTGTVAPANATPPQPPRINGAPLPRFEEYPRIQWGYSEDVPKDFDADHFATSGDRADRVQKYIKDRVREYQPDILLVLLGFNDLTWGGHQPEDVLISMRTIVDNARSAKSDIKFAIGNIIHRTYNTASLDPFTITYNNLLKDAIPTWTTTSSPIHHVDVASAYTCGPNVECTSTFDGLHPNILGAYEIARAFSEVLVTHFSLGQTAVQVPSVSDLPPERGLPPPENISAIGSPMGITVTWDRVYGITEWEIRTRRVYGSPPWSTILLSAPRFDTVLESAGMKYEYQLRSRHGLRSGEWSNVVTAVSTRRTAPPPENIRTSATALGFRVSWDPPRDREVWNISQYDIRFHNLNTSLILSLGATNTSTSELLEGPPSGDYSIVNTILNLSVSTWTYPEGGGLYAAGKPVYINGAGVEKGKGMGALKVPTNVTTGLISETAVQVSWEGSEGVAGYVVRVRKNGNGGEAVGETEQDTLVPFASSSTTIPILFPSDAFAHTLCLTSHNGDNESRPTCVPLLGQTAKSKSRIQSEDGYLRFFTYWATVYFGVLVVIVLVARTKGGAFWNLEAGRLKLR